VRRLLLTLLAACACARPAPDAPLGPGDHTLRLEHGGRERSYVLHVPPRPAEPAPLLLAFHGGAGNGPGFQRYAGLDPLADRDGWLVAYPNGTSRLFDERLLTWNAGGCCGYAQDEKVDDVGFALALIEDAARRVPGLDRARVYATGHSNGAMMAYRLAAEASEHIAAIAPVAGAMSLDVFAPRRPVPVLHIHSVDDPRALYAGGVTETAGREIRHRPVEAELARWRERDACPKEATELEKRSRPAGKAVHTATLFAWEPCADGTEVRLWKLTGGGHGWPGADPVLRERVMGPRTDVISAAEEIWRFVGGFSRFAPSRATGDLSKPRVPAVVTPFAFGSLRARRRLP
jgi:polyhydroxybutyrate depolymerase